MRCGAAVLALAGALSAATLAEAAAPVARHLAITVGKDAEVVFALGGYDADGDTLTSRITSVPQQGSLYQISQIFSDYGYAPKRGDQFAAPAGTGTVVTGSKHRIVYTPPANTNEPTEKWASFTYTVSDGTTTSEPGIVWLVPPSKMMVSSDFSAGLDGWTVADNGARASALPAGGLAHEAFSRGLLNHYVLATDAEIHTSKVSGWDDSRWYFVAPSKFLGNHAVAYGGSLVFSMASAAGDFAASNINGEAAVVVLDCATCNSGSGVRLATFADASTVVLDGKSKTMTLTLSESKWLKDSKNTLVKWANPTQCEMVEVLSGLTGVKILGDHTKWYESVALDDVAFKHGSSVPVACAGIYY